jgi:hypothetical protein
MPAFDVARRWIGQVILDPDGSKVGAIADVFYDQESDAPGWALVDLGDGTTSFVPVGQAVEEDGGLRVPYDEATVRGAPGMTPGGRLWAEEEADLYEYYGLEYSGPEQMDLDDIEEQIDELDPDDDIVSASRMRGRFDDEERLL